MCIHIHTHIAEDISLKDRRPRFFSLILGKAWSLQGTVHELFITIYNAGFRVSPREAAQNRLLSGHWSLGCWQIFRGQRFAVSAGPRLRGWRAHIV